MSENLESPRISVVQNHRHRNVNYWWNWSGKIT